MGPANNASSFSIPAWVASAIPSATKREQAIRTMTPEAAVLMYRGRELTENLSALAKCRVLSHDDGAKPMEHGERHAAWVRECREHKPSGAVAENDALGGALASVP